MREKGQGTILVSGNTQCHRGTAGLSRIAPSKFAQRGLTQCMAQEYKPHGVHVCMVIIDGFVDAPGIRTQKMTAKSWENEQGEPGAYLLNPNDIGEACVYLCKQPQSVWTHEMWLTPKNVVLGQRL
eukprot:g1232.t1